MIPHLRIIAQKLPRAPCIITLDAKYFGIDQRRLIFSIEVFERTYSVSDDDIQIIFSVILPPKQRRLK